MATSTANTSTPNTSTTIEGTTGTSAVDPAGRSIGARLDTLIATAERQPLVAVGIGIVVGYLLARILDR